MSTETCGTPSTASSAETFAHDTASSGGAIYDAAEPLAVGMTLFNTPDVCN